MPLPSPEPGLVICYEFLWRHEHQNGEDRGKKRRPCAIVLATSTEGGQTSVTVAPVTHSQPRNADAAIEIPARVKTHLGLDSGRSWVVITELNQFIWPGLDLYPVPGGRRDQYDYGFLPPQLFRQIVDAILAFDAAEKTIIRRLD